MYEKNSRGVKSSSSSSLALVPVLFEAEAWIRYVLKYDYLPMTDHAKHDLVYPPKAGDGRLSSSVLDLT